MRSQESWASGDLKPLLSNMLPRHISACVLVFFFLEFVQLQQGQLLLLLCQWRLHLGRLQLVLEYHNRFVRRKQRRPHPYYWNLPRPRNSWFEIHFHRRNMPESFFSLIDIFLQIMACKLTNLSDFTPDKNLSRSEAGRRRL